MPSRLNTSHRQSGFSLIELMVALVRVALHDVARHEARGEPHDAQQKDADREQFRVGLSSHLLSFIRKIIGV